MAGPILVGYDGSERGRDALVLGRVLSSALEAPLVVLIAYTPEQWLWAPGTAEPMDPEKRARFVADAETALAGQGEVEIRTLASQSAAGAFQAAPIRDEVRLRTVIAHGASGDAIVEQSEHVDLLVLGARGCGPLKRVLLGSVSRHVVNGARCPVLVVPLGAGAEESSGAPAGAAAAQPGKPIRARTRLSDTLTSQPEALFVATLSTIDPHPHPRRRRCARRRLAASTALWALCCLHLASPSEGSAGWSAPAVLAQCGLAGGPQVAFPSEGPATPSGVGAILWASDPASCTPHSPGSGRWAVSVAALSRADCGRIVGTRWLAGRARIALTAVGASSGRLTVATTSAASAPAGAEGALLQGAAAAASHWPSMPIRSETAPALARAYLGDVAIAAVVPGPAIAVRLERSFQSGFGPAQLVPIGAGPVTALTATMDYLSDVLLAWQQGGAVYARMLRVSGRSDPTQRVGASAPDPQIQAVVSDNGHGMIVWSSTVIPERSARTRIYLDLSAAGVRFGHPLQLASFADPQQVGRRPGSLKLERLSTENVMLAWTVAEDGHYAVHAAPAVFAASRPATLLSDPHSQAILSDLAPGPTGEAIALWSTMPRAADGTLASNRAQLWAVRTDIRPPAHVVLRRPKMIAAAGPNVAATVAVDPANDRAVAAWLALATPERVEYAVGGGVAGYRPRPPSPAAARPGGGVHWLRITMAAAGVACAMLLLAATRRRRRARAA